MRISDWSSDVCYSDLAVVSLLGRPVLFALARVLAEAWPQDASRDVLIARAFGGRHADESHRARLRVEIGRLRASLRPLAGISATPAGFVLKPVTKRLDSMVRRILPVSGSIWWILRSRCWPTHRQPSAQAMPE